MNEFVEKYRLACRSYVDKQKAADVLNDNAKIVFAQISSCMDASSEAAKQRLALLSDDWKEYVEKRGAANSAAREANIARNIRQMEFDAWRTEAANSRRERDAGRFGT